MTFIANCDPTPAQLKQWEDTRAALVWHAPAFTHILYQMMNKSGSAYIAVFNNEKDPNGNYVIPVAATDGANVIINPDTFFPLTLSERIFVVAHEISHGIFAHCELMHKLRVTGKVTYPDGKELSYDQEDMNKAMDYVINDMLIESKIGTYNSNWLNDTVIGKHDDDVLTVYRRIHQDKAKGGSGGKGGQSGFDAHLPPGASQGQDPATAASNRNDMQWKTAIAGAAASAKAQGKLPAALERMLSDALEPQVDWTDKIISFFNRRPGGGTYDWKKADRRFITRGIVTPARSGYGAGPLVVAIDTSGSIGQREVDLFFAEMYGILDDVRPTMIHVMWCDAHVGRVDDVEDTSDLLDLRMKKVPGGGGTDFIPVFDKIAELGIEPEALIYLTDGDGRFPQQAPAYSVLWGDISSNAKKYPWGEVVDIPIK